MSQKLFSKLINGLKIKQNLKKNPQKKVFQSTRDVLIPFYVCWAKLSKQRNPCLFIHSPTWLPWLTTCSVRCLSVFQLFPRSSFLWTAGHMKLNGRQPNCWKHRGHWIKHNFKRCNILLAIALIALFSQNMIEKIAHALLDWVFHFY